ncbi:hypothetical protein [Leptospira kanakyensis]|uniref:DUF4760 domain-containing protein n=1 Tax=Leptospira kanakyensis TaxID=2484968 RepID=A0A6N4QR31_9LEPT|nr:hypothetical protein [Leptospira kanakyensis]TGK55733.1 hypothetical protein EHQ11_00080 [Leptospira kanakyensis]TGK76988.1 hypothetical protein EHQ18_00050 [Leptospira kanakyensis]
MTDIIAAASALISFYTLVFYLKDRKRLRHSILVNHINNLVEWHSDTVNILIKLQFTAKNNKPLDDLKADLSIQIEKGRFFFPNINKKDNFGIDKPKAYQGYRSLALDFLVYSFEIYSKENPLKYLEHANRLQREYTSIVWEIVSPAENLIEIHKLTDRYLHQEKILEDYLKSDPNSHNFFFH